MPVVIPTKTEDSIGIEKSDNLPDGVTLDERHWTTAAQLETIKDTLIALAEEVGETASPDAGSLRGRVDALEGGGGGGSSRVLWKWNETDATEFVVPHTTIALAAPTLSRVLGVDGPRLRVAFPTKITGYKIAAIMIDFDIAAVGNLRRYVLEYDVVGLSNPALHAEWSAVGSIINGNDVLLASNDFHGIFLGNGTQAKDSWIGKIESAVETAANASDTTRVLIGDPSGPRTHFSTRVQLYHTGAAKPQWSAFHLVQSPADPGGTEGAVMYGGESTAQFEAWDPSLVLNASWNAQVLNRCGIGIQGDTGITAAQYWEFANIRILKHPMDE